MSRKLLLALVVVVTAGLPLGGSVQASPAPFTVNSTEPAEGGLLATGQHKAAEATSSHADAAYQHLADVMDKYHTSFDVYTDVGAAGNHFVHRGRMPAGAVEGLVTIDDASTDAPHSGATCIKNTFMPKPFQSWGGWYFLNGVLLPGDVKPSDGWGEYPDAGFDLTGATKLTFWARGAKGGEEVEFFLAGVGRVYPFQPYPDSSPKISLGFVTLTDSWHKYTINLAGHDLSYVIGGFGWVANESGNPDGAIFYLDDIKFDLPRLEEPRFLVSYETLASTGDFETVMRNVAFTYDNAVAMLAFMARGEPDDWRRAQLLADAFVYAQNHDRYYDDGRLRNAYQGGDLVLFPGWIPNGRVGTVKMPGWWDPSAEQWYEDKLQVGSYTGNIAWAMIALLSFYEARGGEQYLDAALRMGNWIESCCRDERGAGGYTGGFDGWEPAQTQLLWKSTEHNIDSYVVFSRLYRITGDPVWSERAAHARAFVEAMWDEEEGHFWTGTLDDGVTPNTSVLPIDVNTWGLMALGNVGTYGGAISWVADNCYVEADGFVGFDFDCDGDVERDGVWFEGTAHAVIAFRLVGDTTAANTYIGEIRKAQTEAVNANGKGIVAASHDGLTTGFDWLYFARLHVGATAWYLLAEMGVCPLCLDVDGDGCTWAEEAYGAPLSEPGSTCTSPSACYSDSASHDFYDVPVPVKPDPTPNGVRNRAVNLLDVLAVLKYVPSPPPGGTLDTPNANGVAYNAIKGSCDPNGDTVPDKDGMCYDRSTSPAPNPPWDAGPPDGAISLLDVIAALKQYGLDCSRAP